MKCGKGRDELGGTISWHLLSLSIVYQQRIAEFTFAFGMRLVEDRIRVVTLFKIVTKVCEKELEMVWEM